MIFFLQVKEFESHFAISEDLANFYNALESALMKFHKERMSIINRMIRDMWHSTYKGKDIDYVEIQADPSKETCILPFFTKFPFSNSILLLFTNIFSCPPAIQLPSSHG